MNFNAWSRGNESISRTGLVNSMRIEKQLTESDCAVWAIKAMCFQIGVPMPPGNVVRKHIDLDEQGTSIRGVRNALEAFGIVPRPVKGPCDAIAQAPMPAIAMIRLSDNRHHYVVVLEANEKIVRYLDPAVGGCARTVESDQFAEMFTGNLVLCERQPHFIEVDLGEEPDANRFFFSTWLHELHSILAMAFGEIFQLLMLLLGILMLKSFFGSSLQGTPNFWFLSGMALCGIVYVWVASLIQLVQGDIKSRTLLSLFDFSTALIRKREYEAKGGLQKTSSRCIKVITAVATSVTGSSMLPGHTVSLLLYVLLLAWVDPYAAAYAVGVALITPGIGLWLSGKRRLSQQAALKSRDVSEMGLVYLLADRKHNNEVVSDLLWNQLGYCDSLESQRKSSVAESMLYEAVGRLNIFAGLLIGGLQHASLGLGHTIAVFFLLSIYTGVVGRWSRRISALPDCWHQIRSLLDFFSDFTTAPLTRAEMDVSGSARILAMESRSSIQDRSIGGVG